MATLCRRFFAISTHRSTLRKLSTPSSVDPKEITNFNNLSDQWWSENGEFKALHSMNSLRVPLIRKCLINSGRIPHEAASKLLSLSGIRILDVGSGGGILSEPLARIGADVTGLDASEQAINAACEHAARDEGLGERLHYIHGTLEALVETERESFDAVVASEVIEHMTSPSQCISLCSQLIKPGGSLFVTTLNRTALSWLGAIVLAERIAGFVPAGTHDWDKFISPTELTTLVEDNGCSVRLVHGMAYNPVNNSWCWTSNTAVNYALHAVKRQQTSASQDLPKSQNPSETTNP